MAKQRTYFTRKNLLTISLMCFYAFILVFTGICLDGASGIVKANNPIAKFAEMLNFASIDIGLNGIVTIILIAIYIVIMVIAVIFEVRFAVLNNNKATSAKMWCIYIPTILLCIAMPLGIGIVLQNPLTVQSVSLLLMYIWRTLIIGTIIYAALFVIFGSVVMFIVNFIHVDKPFKFFNEQNMPIIDEMEEQDQEDKNIAKSFKTNEEVASSIAAAFNGTGGAGVPGIQTPPFAPERGVFRSEDKLETREKVFPTLSKIDDILEGNELGQVLSDPIELDELCVRFRNYLAKKENLYFDMETIRFFVSGFAASHFMILEGLSGTGKSSLPRYFAKFIGAELLFMPVQATWRDKTNILGYFNEFSKAYNETEFLVKLYQSNYNKDQIYIYVLDEMNISRVEYYFADLLSVLEYPQDQWKLKIMQIPYNFIPPIKLEEGIIQIPTNSYFVGTANKDDSTFTITDKVYDRAITIEFSVRNNPFTVQENVEPIHLSSSHLNALYAKAQKKATNQVKKDDLNKLYTIADYIYNAFDISIGNRILNQITNLVPVYVACGGKKEEAIDFLVAHKLIGKIAGRFEDYVKGSLKELLVLIEKTYGSHVLKRSEKLIENMIRRL